MAQTGEIVFFTCDPIDSHASLVPQLCSSMDGSNWLHVSTMARENRAWEAFQLRQDGKYSKADHIQPAGFAEMLNFVALTDLPHHIGGLHGQLVEVLGSAIGMRIVRAVQRDIPKEILGNFEPSDAFIKTGEHDIFSYLSGPTAKRDGEGEYFGRATLSVSFFGYGFPSNWPRCRELILQVPEVMEFKRTLEGIVGPMDQTVIWTP